MKNDHGKLKKKAATTNEFDNTIKYIMYEASNSETHKKNRSIKA